MNKYAFKNEFGRAIIAIGDAEEFEASDDSSFMAFLNGPVAWVSELVPSRQLGSRRNLLETVIDLAEREDVLVIGISLAVGSGVHNFATINAFMAMYEELGFQRVGNNAHGVPIMVRYTTIDPSIVSETIDRILGISR